MPRSDVGPASSSGQIRRTRIIAGWPGGLPLAAYRQTLERQLTLPRALIQTEPQGYCTTGCFLYAQPSHWRYPDWPTDGSPTEKLLG